MRNDFKASEGDLAYLLHTDEFAARHLGSDEHSQQQMLEALGVASIDALLRQAVPEGIRLARPLALGEPVSEAQALAQLKASAGRNELWRSVRGRRNDKPQRPPA